MGRLRSDIDDDSPISPLKIIMKHYCYYNHHKFQEQDKIRILDHDDPCRNGSILFVLEMLHLNHCHHAPIDNHNDDSFPHLFWDPKELHFQNNAGFDP